MRSTALQHPFAVKFYTTPSIQRYALHVMAEFPCPQPSALNHLRQRIFQDLRKDQKVVKESHEAQPKDLEQGVPFYVFTRPARRMWELPVRDLHGYGFESSDKVPSFGLWFILLPRLVFSAVQARACLETPNNFPVHELRPSFWS